MLERRIPEWLRHAPTPGVRGFAVLAGIEAVARGMLISVFPLAMYGALQDARLVSGIYFLVGLASLAGGLMVPFVGRFVPRRWIYSIGASLSAGGAVLAIAGNASSVVSGLLMVTLGTVTTFICFNAYVLDYIAKRELGRCETSRLFYSALGWTVGPGLGVVLFRWWAPAPFVIAALASAAMLATFLYLRLGNGKLIVKSHRPPPNPLAFLPRFVAQPRLLAGWTFAVVRSCGWWVYIVYLPIFAIEEGLGETLGGIALSLTNGVLFLVPVMLAWMQRHSIRRAVRTGFLMAGMCFVVAALASGVPWVSVACLMAGSVFLILLDVSGGLPFLMAVRPSQRTEMSAVYASYRDVSGIVTPGAAWLVLLAAPVSGVFLACGVGLVAAWGLAGTLHPRLGRGKISIEPAQRDLPAPPTGAPAV